MRKIFAFLLATSAFATSAFYDVGILDTDGTTKIAWVGSSTAFSGVYRWPVNREPLNRYNGAPVAGGQLSTEADFVVGSCDWTLNTCSVVLSNYYGRRLENGGLPDGTEVKFTTTGTLPSGLIAWSEDQHKKYYIRDWSGVSFKLALSAGGPAIPLTSATGSGTHGMTFAGYHNAMAFRLSKVISFTCNPATDVCTSSVPHLRVSGNTGFVHSSNTLPGGFPYQFSASEKFGYCFEVLSSTTFKFRTGGAVLASPSLSANCIGTAYLSRPVVDITSAGIGTHYFHTQVNVQGASEYPLLGQPPAFWSMTGYPRGTTITFRSGSYATAPYNWNPGTAGSSRPAPGFNTDWITQTVIVKIPAVTPAGTYTVSLTSSDSTSVALNPATYTFPFKVVAITAPSLIGPTSYPPIPGHTSSALTTGNCGNGSDAGNCSWASWENIMTSASNGGGASVGPGSRGRRCIDRTNPTAPFGTDPSVPTSAYNIGYSSDEKYIWYYNDETYRKIADYTKDRTWANCAVHIATVMRDATFTFGPPSKANRHFPWTLVAGYAETRDPSYRAAALKLIDEGTYKYGHLDDVNSRENIYALEKLEAKRALTGLENYDMEHLASVIIGQIYMHAVGAPDRVFSQPFFVGLAARALIRWYAISRDERVPYVLKLWMDKAYADWFSTTQSPFPGGSDYATGTMLSGFLYNAEPAGLRCSGQGCQVRYGSILNALIAPMWAWYWRLTGEEQYRTQGDIIFSYIFRDGAPYDAKEWSQTYYWTWDYVDWRLGKKSAF